MGSGKAAQAGAAESSTCRGWAGAGADPESLGGVTKGHLLFHGVTLPPLHHPPWLRGVQGSCCGHSPGSKQLLETCTGSEC